MVQGGRTWRDPVGELRQGELSLVVERFDQPADLDARWESVEQAPVELVDVAGAADPVELSPRRPAGSWDDAVAGAAARTLSGAGPQGDQDLTQVLLRAWVRRDDALLDVSLLYEVPTATTADGESLEEMQTVVDRLLARVPTD